MIELIEVSRTVTSGAGSLTILHPTSSASRAAESVAITGPSGSGKSTLLGLMAGLDAPTTGRILLDGADITAMGEEALARLRGEKVGIVFQFFHLIPSLTALENILVPMEIAGAKDAPARARALLADVGLVGPRASLSVAAVGRRAAAHRDRARARQRSADPARRRAHGQSRHRDRPPGDRAARRRSTAIAAGRSCSSRTTPSSRRSPASASRCVTAASSSAARTPPRPRGASDALRDPHGVAGDALVLGAPAVLLRLRGARGRRDHRPSQRRAASCARRSRAKRATSSARTS